MKKIRDIISRNRRKLAVLLGLILVGIGMPKIDALKNLPYYLYRDSLCYDFQNKGAREKLLKNCYPTVLSEQKEIETVEVYSDQVLSEEEKKLTGDFYYEGGQHIVPKENNKTSSNTSKNTIDYIQKNFIVDSTTSLPKNMIQVKKFLNKNLKLPKSEKPQILIYHTHGASEHYLDSKTKQDSVVGTGTLLTEILEKEYGYKVIHDKTEYDYINGRIERSLAYNKALAGVKKILEENPFIEVVIDLHRDGVPGNQSLAVNYNGRKTAKIMFFNGLSRSRQGPIEYLYNPNIEGNLAFSMQLKTQIDLFAPQCVKQIYLKGYRYNLHLKERSLLVELGNQNNTVEEIHNAVPVLAKAIYQVLN